jgi:alpha-mannosidase
MEVISGVTAKDVDTPTTRPSPPVGQSWTDSMEGAIGVATHHDGMSGTERQDVSDDYSQRISEGHFEVEAGVAMSLQKLTGITEEIGHCNCNAAGNCLNMSLCAYTTGVDEFTVLAWNPEGQKASNWLRIPVSGAAYTVTDLSSKKVLPSQATLIDNRTHELPLLYINKHGMKAAELAAEEAKLSNKATHVLNFEASTPAVGYSSFSVKKSAASEAVITQPVATPSTVSNGVYELTINQAKGSIESVKNIASGVETTFNVTWGYYVSSEGSSTKTKLPNGTVETSGQASGAYMFRPDDQFTHACATSQPTIEVSTGPLVTEIKQTFASWATHVIRLTKGSPYVEVEWTAGPIPWNEGPKGHQGKELVVKFSSGLASDGVFYTDSNGREMLKRKRDARGPSYPPFVINEPVAENYCASLPAFLRTQLPARLILTFGCARAIQTPSTR